MRIHPRSDFHGRLPPPLPEADLYVVAGDVSNDVVQSVRVVQDSFPENTILVPGNHEFYSGVDVQRANKYGESHSDFYYAPCNALYFADENVTFVTNTLWTDMEFGHGNAMRGMVNAQHGLNDFHFIQYQHCRFTASKARALHFAAKKDIAGKIRWARKDNPDTKIVVVTHHAPHPNSVADKYVGDPINVGFVSDMRDFIDEHKPDLWIHGHTHHFFDYTWCDTRIVCNPLGHAHEDTHFRSNFIVEV